MSRNATSFGTNSAMDVRAFLRASSMVLSFIDGSEPGCDGRVGQARAAP